MFSSRQGLQCFESTPFFYIILYTDEISYGLENSTSNGVIFLICQLMLPRKDDSLRRGQNTRELKSPKSKGKVPSMRKFILKETI